MYPSVAFWNPYNLSINLKDIFIEVPINVQMSGYNSKEWDLFEKWYIHNPNATASYIPYDFTTSSTTMPTQNWQVPGGTRPYIDTNGNGRWDRVNLEPGYHAHLVLEEEEAAADEYQSFSFSSRLDVG